MDVIFNGKRNRDVGIAVKGIPNTLITSNRKYDTKFVPGRDGNFNIFQGYTDTVITVDYNFYNLNKENFQKQWAIIKEYFTNITDNKLVFSNDLEHFYKVKMTQIVQNERTTYIGRFTVNFTCEPFIYLTEGLIGMKLPMSSEITLYNPCFSIAKPTFNITGEGQATITINNNSCTFNVGQTLTVDTEKQLCYRNKNDFFNSSMTGSYEDLYLQTGANTIEVSGDGVQVEIIPNWREE